MHDAFTIKSDAYLVFEAFGTDLRKVLHQLGDANIPSAFQIRTVLLHISEALQHISRKGFIHTDVKSQNILVQIHNGQWSAKLADLGSAVEASDLRFSFDVSP